jgi:DNA-binding Lrp family transcriptional regulator
MAATLAAARVVPSPEEVSVITGFVLLDVDVDRVPEVAEELTELAGVTEVYSVTGRYDLIVKVKVAHNEDLADVVTGRIGKVPGIRGSETVIAFRTYSEQALDAGFALGQDPPD